MPSENLRAFSQGIFLYILSKKKCRQKISGHFLRAFFQGIFLYILSKS